MKEYLVTYETGYGYAYFRTYAKNRHEAITDFYASMGNRYPIVEVERIYNWG